MRRVRLVILQKESWFKPSTHRAFFFLKCLSSTGASSNIFVILALLVVGVSQNASSSSGIQLNGSRVGGWRTKNNLRLWKV